MTRESSRIFPSASRKKARLRREKRGGKREQKKSNEESWFATLSEGTFAEKRRTHRELFARHKAIDGAESVCTGEPKLTHS